MSLYCNGRPATVEDLGPALTNYGHFTSLQVRDDAVQGLALHLARLRQGSAALFGADNDDAQLLGWLRAALDAADVGNASLRITQYSRQFDFRHPARTVPVDVLVAVSAPVTAALAPRRLRAVCAQRELPHLKHVGTFGLFQHRREALAAGFDDALLVAADGTISEGTTWNIAFWDGAQLVWPDAPALRGTHEQLLQAGWGAAQRREPVHLGGLGAFSAAIACNASGVWPVASIDAVGFSGSVALCNQARKVLAQAPWERL